MIFSTLRESYTKEQPVIIVVIPQIPAVLLYTSVRKFGNSLVKISHLSKNIIILLQLGLNCYIISLHSLLGLDFIEN